jgi:hypothetical protein
LKVESDGLEIGGWNISVYFEATGEKRSGYPIVVNSDPWTTDTDSDGLTDGQEFENATHPNHTDTDGDGMTDLWELTGPAPSDPCGIEGTPPNLSDLKVTTEEDWEWQWVGVGIFAAPVYIRTRSEIKVTVRATDNVGLDWIRFNIDGKGEETVNFAQYTNNSTATVFFDHSFWNKWASGYDLNITVSDVNGNEGYMEFHIDSVLEAFVQWLIGQVTALAEFVMELASAAIQWVWDFVETIVSSILDPIFEYGEKLGFELTVVLELIMDNYQITGAFEEEDKTSLSSVLVSPQFFTWIAFSLAMSMIISIIKYFIPFMAWLLVGIMCFAFTIFSLVAIDKGTSTDEVDSNFDNYMGLTFELSFTNIYGNIMDWFAGDEGESRSLFESFIDCLVDNFLKLSILQFCVDLFLSVYLMTSKTLKMTSVGKRLLVVSLGILILGGLITALNDVHPWVLKHKKALGFFASAIGCLGMLFGTAALIPLAIKLNPMAITAAVSMFLNFWIMSLANIVCKPKTCVTPLP